MRKHLQFVSVLVAVLSLLAAFGTPASAKQRNRKVNSTVNIVSIDETEISGTLTASRAACVDGRVIDVTVDGADAGSAIADPDGSWVIGADVNDGDVVVARVEKVVNPSKRKGLVCKADSDRKTADLPAPTLRTLTVNVTTAGGRVDSSPGGITNCRASSGSCVADFANNSVVQLTATPDAGQDFAGWGGACSGQGTCSVQMNADRGVTASFVAEPGEPAPSCAIPEDVPEPIRGVLCTVVALLGG